MSGPPQPPPSGMSLYANLLDTTSDSSAGASISRAPVLFKQSDDKDDASKKPLDPGATYSMLARSTPYTLN
jgi:splicing factor 45